jgi:hypothetical protein
METGAMPKQRKKVTTVAKAGRLHRFFALQSHPRWTNGRCTCSRSLRCGSRITLRGSSWGGRPSGPTTGVQYLLFHSRDHQTTGVRLRNVFMLKRCASNTRVEPRRKEWWLLTFGFEYNELASQPLLARAGLRAWMFIYSYFPIVAGFRYIQN